LERLPKDIIEELIRPFLLEGIDNPEGVAALIERFLLARREQMAFQAQEKQAGNRQLLLSCQRRWIERTGMFHNAGRTSGFFHLLQKLPVE
jgi:hypothetical protein